MTPTPSINIGETAVDLRTLIGKLSRRLRAQAAPNDLTPSQTLVLAHLERNGPASVTQLATAHAVRPQSMGATVAVLEAAGFVTGASDPDDGRRTILSLTDEARRWVAESRAAKEDWLVRTIDSRLSPDEQRELVAAMGLLRRLLEPIQDKEQK